MVARRRRFLPRLLALAIGCLLACVLGELAATIHAWLRFGTVSVARLHDLEQGNAFLRTTDEPYLNTLFPHPYLGFVHDRNFGGAEVNNIGLFGGRPMPLSRREDTFTILVLGGSVAAQFAQTNSEGEHALEDLLNSQYDFDGKRAVVLNGADGGWKQPQQLIALSLYGDVVDAVISLEGFNELRALSARRLEYLADFVRVDPLARAGVQAFARAAVGSALHDLSRHNGFVASSRALYFAGKSLRSALVSLFDLPPHEVAQMNPIESVFALPAEWGMEQRVRYNVAQYEKYLRLTDRVAAELGLQRAFFLQAVPAIGKVLTADEQRALGPEGTDYGPLYQLLVDRLLRLRASGVQVFSLLDVFADEPRTIYADAAHCRADLPRNGSTGYRIIAQRIATVLERAWGLRRRS